MGAFSSTATAQEVTRSAYIKPGKYELMLKALKYIKGYNGETVVGEFKVVSAVKTDPASEPNPVGTTCAGVVKMQPTTLGLVKNLINACSPEALPTDPAAWEAAAEKMCSPSQPMRGVMVGCEAQTTNTKAGKEITGKNYRSVGGQTGESILANRRALDAAGE